MNAPAAAGSLSASAASRSILAGAWPVAAGLAALWAVSSARLWTAVWSQPEHGHEVLLVAAALALAAIEGRRLAPLRQTPSLPWIGLLITGALAVLLGARVSAAFLEGGGLVLATAAALGLLGGRTLVARLWLPLTLLLLAVPLPGNVLGWGTAELKTLVSASAEHLLRLVDYPVARNGVALTIGNYELLVADACSGWASLQALLAVGLVFVHQSDPTQRWRRAAVVAAIVPCAIVANVVRVVTLILITYHLGDEAGQGFLHGLAGIVLYGAALLGLMLIARAIGLRMTPLTEAPAPHA